MGITMAAALVLLAPNENASAQTLYGGIGTGSPSNPGSLIIINQANGVGTVVGHPDSVPGLSGLASDSTGALYGSTITGPPGIGTSNLVRINPETGAQIYSAPITLSGTPIGVNDLAVQPGTNLLFGSVATETSTILVTIDKTAGAATVRAEVANLGGAIAFAPDGTLYETSIVFGEQQQSFLNTIDAFTGAILTTVPTDEFYGGLVVRPDGTIFASAGMIGEIDILNPNGTSADLGSTGVGGVGDLAFVSVSGGAFNTCLQDESNGNILLLNTATGDYQFINCGGLSISGAGSLIIKGSDVTLQHNTPDRRVVVKIAGQANRGTASVQLLPDGTVFTISDRDLTNNTCTCQGPTGL